MALNIDVFSNTSGPIVMPFAHGVHLFIANIHCKLRLIALVSFSVNGVRFLLFNLVRYIKMTETMGGNR